MTVGPRDYRRALGRFATGVTVVTAEGANGALIGVTISAMASVSLDPPLVLFCLGKTTASFEAYTEGERFAVNILAEDQRELSERFATRNGDRFAGVAFRRGDGGCPLIEGCLGVLECTRVAAHDGGDHVIVVGRVERCDVDAERRPLLHFRGQYAGIGGAI